jgi:hypothetical protein
MDQRVRASPPHQAILSSAGLRRFTIQALAALLLCWAALAAGSATRPWAGAVWWGGGWMLGNCLGLYALSLMAAHGDTQRHARLVTWTAFLTIGYLLVGGGLLMVARPSLFGITVGITAVVGIFFWHLGRARMRQATPRERDGG